jgi:hypothetical protein
MKGWSRLKWTADGPARLRAVLREIEVVPDDQYGRWQEEARAYVLRYLTPRTDEALARFCTV